MAAGWVHQHPPEPLKPASLKPVPTTLAHPYLGKVQWRGLSPNVCGGNLMQLESGAHGDNKG